MFKLLFWGAFVYFMYRIYSVKQIPAEKTEKPKEGWHKPTNKKEQEDVFTDYEEIE